MRSSILAILVAGWLCGVPLRAADGTLDTSFNGVGYVVLAPDGGGNNNDVVMDAAEGPGGFLGQNPLYLVGYGTHVVGPNPANNDWELWQINQTGSMSVFGWKSFDRGGSNNDYALAVVADGQKVVVAGIADTSDHADIEVCRWDSGFNVDTSFGPNNDGCFVYDPGAGTTFWINRMVRLPDDAGFAIAGTLYDGSGQGWFVLRLTSSGHLNIGYGQLGLTVVRHAGNFTLHDMAVGVDDETLLVGEVFESGGERMAFALVDGQGTPVNAFGNSGLEIFFDPTQEIANCAAFEAPQHFTVGITTYDATATSSKATAYRMDDLGDFYAGLPSDASWDAAGFNVPVRILPQGDGSFLVASYYTDSNLEDQVFAGTRFSCLGCTADTSFGTSGLAELDPSVAGVGHGTLTTATLWGGRLVEVGQTDAFGSNNWLIVRFTSSRMFADGLETGDDRRWSAHAP